MLGVVPGRPHQRHPVTEEARTHCRRVTMFYFSILSKNKNRFIIYIYTFSFFSSFSFVDSCFSED